MNLPNRITMVRILMVPLLVLLYLFPYHEYNIEMPVYVIQGVSISLLNIILLIVFMIASISDFIDGYIARKYHLVTTLGKFLDPIADKLLVNTLFILFAISGVVSVIPVLLMIWRDTIVDALRMMSASKGIVVAAHMSGKLKTVLQMVAIVVILLENIPFVWIHVQVDTILLWAATITSLYSGYLYFNQMKAVVLESK